MKSSVIIGFKWWVNKSIFYNANGTCQIIQRQFNSPLFGNVFLNQDRFQEISHFNSKVSSTDNFDL